MRHLLLASAALSAACAPPPVPEGLDGDASRANATDPTVEILVPGPNTEVIGLDDEGRLQFLVVGELDNIDWISPADVDEDVEGQAHFHVNLNGTYIDAPVEQAYVYTSRPDEFAPGDTVILDLTLSTNTHEDLDLWPTWKDTLAFTVGERGTGPGPGILGGGEPVDTGDTDDGGGYGYRGPVDHGPERPGGGLCGRDARPPGAVQP